MAKQGLSADTADVQIEAITAAKMKNPRAGDGGPWVCVLQALAVEGEGDVTVELLGSRLSGVDPTT